jgi:allantoicase
MTERAYYHLPDLASRVLGGSVVYANDELFAERENLINPEPPQFLPHTFGHKGQVMDGWETRRRREPGADTAILRLGAAGIIRGVLVDTSYFTGNYPPEISVDACGVEGYPAPHELLGADWVPIVPRSRVNGNAQNEFDVTDPYRYTHVRLTMYPDGGVARLRVRGEVVVDPRLLPPVFDVAALDNGGQIAGASNVFYSSPGNLILPGSARAMGDGWETARRRDDGNDWVDLELACAAQLLLCELDTSYFVGNSPGWASLRTPDGVQVLPRTPLLPDCRQRFAVTGEAAQTEVRRLRMDVYPDGGLARLRLIGRPTESGRAQLALRFINALPPSHLVDVLLAAALDRTVAEALTDARPLADIDDLPDMLRERLRGVGVS